MPPKIRKLRALIREHLAHNFGQTTIGRLAQRMKVPAERFRTVVDAGYLKVVLPTNRKGGGSLVETVVELPSPSLMAWLKQMLRPWEMRPLMQLNETAEMLGIPVQQLRELCHRNKLVELHVDPAFGELISPRDLHHVLKMLPPSHGLPRFDRISLLQFMVGKPAGTKMRNRVVPYSKQLEREIQRIARMTEPDRTICAVTLWEAMEDARSVAACMKQYRESMMTREEVKQAAESMSQLLSVVAVDDQRV